MEIKYKPIFEKKKSNHHVHFHNKTRLNPTLPRPSVLKGSPTCIKIYQNELLEYGKSRNPGKYSDERNIRLLTMHM